MANNMINSLKYGDENCSLAIPYGVCSTAANTAAKTVTISNFALTTGSMVVVKFTNANSAASPTLNVNGTGAKAIMRYGTTSASTDTTTTGWVAGAVQMFTYDGTNWVRDYWNNTTYSAAGSSLGLVKSGGDVTISSGTITVNDDSHNHVISNIDNLQTTLDGKQATITGAASTIASSNLTKSRALVSDSSGKVAVSAVTSTELGYLDGVKSNIQTQINTLKSPTVYTDKITLNSSHFEITSNHLVDMGNGMIYGRVVGKLLSDRSSTQIGYINSSYAPQNSVPASICIGTSTTPLVTADCKVNGIGSEERARQIYAKFSSTLSAGAYIYVNFMYLKQ